MFVVVTVLYKLILKELLKKLHLLYAIYECKKIGLDYRLIFIVKIIFKKYTYRKKDIENEIVSRVLRI